MPNFILLLYDDPSSWQKISPDEMQKALEKYMAWGQKPFVVGTLRLAEDVGRVMRGQNGKPNVTDGPYSETKEILGGFYTIEADNYDQAVERARDHPHLEYGGTIEVRQPYGP
jgi:hypothetical protein